MEWAIGTVTPPKSKPVELLGHLGGDARRRPLLNLGHPHRGDQRGRAERGDAHDLRAPHRDRRNRQLTIVTRPLSSLVQLDAVAERDTLPLTDVEHEIL